jgi:hypothetical protein
MIDHDIVLLWYICNIIAVFIYLFLHFAFLFINIFFVLINIKSFGAGLKKVFLESFVLAFFSSL